MNINVLYIIMNTHTDSECKKGKLYCLHNVIFNYYGPNVFKLGCSTNVDKRVLTYITSYPDKSEIMHSSDNFDNCFDAEKILFRKLNKYRMRDRREFFQCPLEIIINAIKAIELGDYQYEKHINSLTREENIKLIFDAEDIDDNMFFSIGKKINCGEATEANKFAYQKYEFKKTWKLDKLEMSDLNTYFRKENVLTNLKYLFGQIDEVEDTCKKQCEVIREIIGILGFDTDALVKKLDKDTFYVNVNELLNKSKFSCNYKQNKILFGKNNNVLNKKLNGIHFINMVNSYLNVFGLEIKVKSTQRTVKRKKVCDSSYKLSILQDYAKYI